MALATKCPHCGTTFRVASDQLKLRGGIVRCGSCQHIFDGNANLIELDALAAQKAQADAHPVEQAPAAEAAHAPAEPQAAPGAEPEEIPVYEVDLSSTLDPLGILPKPEAEGTETAAAPDEVEEIEEIEVIDMARQPDLVDQAQSSEAPAAEPLEDETAAAPVEPVEAQTEAAAHAQAETEDNLAATDAEPAGASEAGPASHPTGDSKAFSMGSALLSEPDQLPAGREARIEPTLDLHVDEELVAAAPPVDHNEPVEMLQVQADNLARYAGEHTPLPMREAADTHFGAAPAAAPVAPPRPKSRLGRRSKLTPTKIAPPKLRVPEIDEPEFVKRGRQQEKSGKRWRILMATGSVVLALALVAQAAATFRNELASRVPALKPALAAACSVMRCRVELPAKIENLTIETGDLQTSENTYVLTTLLHNQAGMAQAWPAIELTLTDTNDKPLLRRVFTPAEYLPQGVAPAAGFGPHAEQPVKLYFQLDQLKPSGYHIAVFYP